MATTVRTVTATGGSVPVPINPRTFKGGVGILVSIPEGSTATYDVEVTGADPTTPQADWQWNKHDVLQGKTASANSNLAYPVTAIRLNPSNIGGSLVMAVIQVES